MGTLCIIGVDDDKILKDFVRAHVDGLAGAKVCLDNWHPNYRLNGRTIRYFHSARPIRAKLLKLLPQVLYSRLVTRRELTEESIHDALSGFFRAHAVDVILAEFGPAGADITPHAKALGIPLVVHFHGHDAHRSSTVNEFRNRYREMFEYAHSLMSVSHYMTRALVELGAHPSKIVYNPYGPRDSYYDIRPDYSKTILSLGRFTDIKANYLTLMAFRMALASVPDARLVMVGGGELLETCRTLADTWGIADSVSFPGEVAHADTPRWFAHACCFAQHSVIPSYGDAEGTPVAVLEAGAAGLPVVATRHAGIGDVVMDGKTGYLVAERDVNGMASAMVDFLNNPERARSMGEAAREHIRTNYSLEKHVGNLQRSVDSARQSGIERSRR
jgi:glycosyltransferase involved in cell wall biosynthesis